MYVILYDEKLHQVFWIFNLFDVGKAFFFSFDNNNFDNNNFSTKIKCFLHNKN